MESTTLRFVAEHGYTVLFAWVIAEQAGMPIPAIPILLAAGALSRTGVMNLPLSLALTMVAALAADFIWYELGRRKGLPVLNFLCRVSLEPDTCVRQTEMAFSKHGMRSLIVSKFIPGLNTAAPPLAGIFRTPRSRFFAYDALGTFIWAGTFLGVGRIFSQQIEQIAKKVMEFGASAAQLIIGSLVVYVVYKWVRRQLLIRELRVLRLDPHELKKMLDEGHPVTIVDLRHPVDFENEPHSILGALRMSPEELETKHEQIPRDQDVILYCT
ncbi:MAG TPA: VTT domain-containing protein [Terriglobales bacterium]|nr:VTT domain-containing protein [Terriglobales bacterium]